MKLGLFVKKLMTAVDNRGFSSLSRDTILNKLANNNGVVFANIKISKPEYFNKRFKIVEPIIKLDLEIKNPYLNDIAFSEDNLIKNDIDQRIKFVTDVVSTYFDQFDPVTALEKMMNGGRWPRKEYSYPNGNVMNEQTILRKWEDLKIFSSNKEIWMKYVIEKIINAKDVHTLTYDEFRNFNSDNYLYLEEEDFLQFEEFRKNYILHKKIEPYRTEWNIFCKEFNLKGKVNFVGKLNDDTYCIIDWVRRDIMKNFDTSYGTALPPLNNIDNCHLQESYLRLNLYKYILERDYDMKISSMIVANFHPKNQEFGIYNAPIMETEIEAILVDIKNEY